MSRTPWFRDRRAWQLIAYGYLPWFAGLNLAWEVAHVRLYTLWTEAEPAYIAFSVVHCTLGDILIGGLALLLALILGREGELLQWRWRRITLLAMVFGLGYTIFSEWMNITILRTWVYGEAMPRLNVGAFDIGLTPLAQWLVLPPLALYFGRLSLDFARTAARR